MMDICCQNQVEATKCNISIWLKNIKGFQDRIWKSLSFEQLSLWWSEWQVRRQVCTVQSCGSEITDDMWWRMDWLNICHTPGGSGETLFDFTLQYPISSNINISRQPGFIPSVWSKASDFLSRIELLPCRLVWRWRWLRWKLLRQQTQGPWVEQSREGPES